MTEPARLTAGDSWSWDREIPGRPGPTWSAIYYFRDAAGDGRLEVPASATGETFTASRTSAQTAAVAPGAWYWTLVVTDGVERFTVDQGEVTVLPDPATSGGYDPRSYYQKLLDAVRAVLADTATHDQASYSIAGRSLSRIPRSELLALESTLKWQVANEKARDRVRKGLRNPRNVGVRFVRP